MLNRLFIIVGVLAILGLGAAFLVPRFIQWGNYRDRMEQIAAEAFGAPVKILGDIEFTLLPEPQLKLANVVVGDPEAPTLSVETVQAEFSLTDFIRDRYLITNLVLDQPIFDATIREDGTVDAGIALPEQVTTSNVTLATASVVRGETRLTDLRTGNTVSVSELTGDLRMDALRGPFAFQGSGQLYGQNYAIRLSLGALDAGGLAQVSAYVSSGPAGATLTAEGQLQTGAAPTVIGSMSLRVAPERNPDDPEEAGRGNLLLTADLEGSTGQLALSNLVMVPDENRTTSRVQGSLNVALGAAPRFDATLAGSLVTLGPRDATQDQGETPYELVRLLGELPMPPVPPMAGALTLDLAGLDLRGAALRDIRIRASTDTEAWHLETATAELAGDARLELTGDLTLAGDTPNFNGAVALKTDRLDALAAMWRPSAPGNPLFNLHGDVTADVALVGETLSLSDGKLTVGEATHAFAAEIGVGRARSLSLSAALGTLSSADSAALGAFLPDLGADPGFGVTFPQGSFSLSANGLELAGLAGTQLKARGSWEGGVLVLDELSAGDLGGAAFQLKLTAFGTLARPEVSGTGTLQVADPNAPALTQFFAATNLAPALQDLVRRSVPADLALRLDPPTGDGGQGMAIAGNVGPSVLTLDARLGTGLLRAFTDSLSIRLDLRSGDTVALSEQLGLGNPGPFPPGTPVHGVAVVEGATGQGFATTLRLDAGAETLGFDGTLDVSDPAQISGEGTVKLAAEDLSALAEQIGVRGVPVPPFNGSATLTFDGLNSIALTEIEGTSNGQSVTGNLKLAPAGTSDAVTGSLAVGGTDIAAVAAVLGGPTALLASEGSVWPDGPFSIGDAPRVTQGRIAVTTPTIRIADGIAVEDAGFDLGWDAERVRLTNLRGRIGTGTVEASAEICCAGELPDKRITGQLALAGVAVGDLAPPAIAGALGGALSGGVRFDGTGNSIQTALAAMTGEGSYSVQDLTISQLNPGVFAAAATLPNVLNADAEALRTTVTEEAQASAFVAPEMRGTFTIAGGVVRSPNTVVENNDARLLGSVTFRLADLGLGGGFTLTPKAPPQPGSLLSEASAAVAVNLGGTLQQPEAVLDVAGMVEGLLAEAYQQEVARLEQLRAEDEARQKAAAEERARVEAEESAQRAAAGVTGRAAAAAAAAKERVEAESARALEAEQRAAAAARAQAAVETAAQESGEPAVPDDQSVATPTVPAASQAAVNPVIPAAPPPSRQPVLDPRVPFPIDPRLRPGGVSASP